jgi:hypothetical protein
MRPYVAKLWTNALRSGDYAQGQEYLNCNNRFCCLGVLCDLYVKHVGYNELPVTVFSNNITEYDGAEAVLPFVVQDWAGMKTCIGSLPDPDENTSLAELNDGGSSFEELAKVIESSLDIL